MNEHLDSFTNPLPQKVDYDLEDHLIYGHQKGWKKVLEWILTIFAWLIIISYVGYLIYGSLAIHYDWYLPEFTIYTREMVIEIQKDFYILFIALLILCVLLIFWKNYNYQKYGKLHRRKFGADVTNAELAKIFELSVEEVEQIQKQRMVVLEHNIVPEDLGMGSKRKQEEEEEE